MTEDRTNTTDPNEHAADSRRPELDMDAETYAALSQVVDLSGVPAPAEPKPAASDRLDAVRAKHPDLDEYIELANQPGWPGGVEAYDDYVEDWPTDLGWILNRLEPSDQFAVLLRLPAEWRRPRVWVDPNFPEEIAPPSFLCTGLCLMDEAREQYDSFPVVDIGATPVPSFLVPGVIPGGMTGMLFAPRECGKSFLAIDLALSVAYGVPWLGVDRERESDPASAIFLLAEGQSWFPQRLAAWLVAHGLLDASFSRSELAEVLDGRVTIAPPPPLDNPSLSAILIREIRNRAARIVVIDTLSAFLGLSGENPDLNKVAGQLMTVLNGVAHVTGATILLIHHVSHGNSKRPLGAVGWGNHTDFMFTIKGGKEAFGQGKPVSLVSEKVKDWKEPEPRSFRFREVHVIRDGERLTSGLVEPADRVTRNSKRDAPLVVRVFEYVRDNPGCAFRHLKAARLAGDSKLVAARDDLLGRDAIKNSGTNGKHSYTVADGWAVSQDRQRLLAPGEEL